VCSFCGNDQEEQPDGRRVIGGPRGVAICSDCVRLCVEILETKPPEGSSPGLWITTRGISSD
jgi:ATP-dependent protease Clp ATPase subunit